jgi:hypothetical protein
MGVSYQEAMTMPLNAFNNDREMLYLEEEWGTPRAQKKIE